MLKPLSLALAAGVAFTAVSAGAVAIPLSAKVAGVQTGPATGLNGKFYDQNIVDPVASHVPGALGAPDGTFHSTSINYCCSGDGISVTGFLRGDGASFTGTDPGSFESSVLTFDGFLNVTDDLDLDTNTDGIQTGFYIGSDDGFDLVIGGVQVGTAGVRSYAYSYMPVEFAETGLYSFSLLYYENYGDDGLTFYQPYMSIEGPSYQVTGDNFYATAPDAGTDVPEPAMLGLFGMGALGLMAARRRR